MVEAGADVDAVDKSLRDNRTPLMKAASQAHLEVIGYLLSIGANPDLQDTKGYSSQDILQLRDNIPSNSSLGVEDENEFKKFRSVMQPVQPIPPIFICPLCMKETFSVRKRRDLLVCTNC